MVKPPFFIIRGIPGTGKSTLAKKIEETFLSSNVPIFHFEADHYFIKDGEYRFDATKLRLAHEWCQNEVRSCLSKSLPVIVSNTFTMWKEIKPYVKMAAQYGHHEIHVIARTEEFGNVHGVPLEKVDEMRRRFQSQHLIAMEIDDELRNNPTYDHGDKNIRIQVDVEQNITVSFE